MKTLFLMRHAKSSWDNGELADFDRPLNARGREAAPLIGEIMYENEFQPEIIISSPAERAKQTATLIKNAAQIDGEIQFDEEIYEASPHALLRVLAKLDEKVEAAMLIGHNPGFEGLLKMLTGEFQPMPTAALAVIDLDTGDWNKITHNGTLRVLIRPKEVN